MGTLLVFTDFVVSFARLAPYAEYHVKQRSSSSTSSITFTASPDDLRFSTSLLKAHTGEIISILQLANLSSDRAATFVWFRGDPSYDNRRNFSINITSLYTYKKDQAFFGFDVISRSPDGEERLQLTDVAYYSYSTINGETFLVAANDVIMERLRNDTLTANLGIAARSRRAIVPSLRDHLVKSLGHGLSEELKVCPGEHVTCTATVKETGSLHYAMTMRDEGVMTITLVLNQISGRFNIATLGVDYHNNQKREVNVQPSFDMTRLRFMEHNARAVTIPHRDLSQKSALKDACKAQIEHYANHARSRINVREDRHRNAHPVKLILSRLIGTALLQGSRDSLGASYRPQIEIVVDLPGTPV